MFEHVDLKMIEQSNYIGDMRCGIYLKKQAQGLYYENISLRLEVNDWAQFDYKKDQKANIFLLHSQASLVIKD